VTNVNSGPLFPQDFFAWSARRSSWPGTNTGGKSLRLGSNAGRDRHADSGHPSTSRGVSRARRPNGGWDIVHQGDEVVELLLRRSKDSSR